MSVEGFKEVKRAVRRPTTDDQYAKVVKSFPEKLQLVKKSPIYTELKESISTLEISETKIRCLALGSISQEALLLYQYLYLVLLAELLDTEYVSLWDPAFNDTDKLIFTERGYKVEENVEESSNYFYFMPHIPVEVLELVISFEKPRAMLTNNVSVYSDKWTDSQLYEKFQYIALLRNCCDKSTINSSVTADKQNGFEIVVRKKNRKNRKKHLMEFSVEYDYKDCYFKLCKSIGLESSKDLTQVYGTAFSDMALYIID